MRTTMRATLVLICLASITFILYATLGGYSQIRGLSFLYSDPESSTTAGSSKTDTDVASTFQDISILHSEDHALRSPRNLEFQWHITSGMRRPDGVLKRVYLINGEFPGPTIESRSGDRLIIEIHNDLEDDQGLSIHWHGLSMRGANDMDGAAGITQSPIPRNSSFVYDFTIDEQQHGTFWWHAHDGVQRADGLYGGLVVHRPDNSGTRRDVRPEHLLLIGDWYHRPAQEALTAYMHPGAFGLETVPDSLLVNGHGVFNCSDAVNARPLDCEIRSSTMIPSINLDLVKGSVLHVVNVGAYAGLSISIVGVNLTPLTVDGGQRVTGDAARLIGVLHPGERISLLAVADPAHKGDAKLNVLFDETPFKYQNPALTPLHQYPVRPLGDVGSVPRTGKSVGDTLDIQNLSSAHDWTNTIPISADRTVVLYTMTQKLARLSNEPHGFINHTHWKPQSPPLADIPRTEWDNGQLVPLVDHRAESPLWIDIVLNNLDEEGHPFHLHGHDFWVLSTYSSTSNWGSYNPFEDAEAPGGEYNMKSAMKKDTVYVPRRGYAVLRLRADNPGLWMFHCHVLWHMASGMAMTLEVK